MQATDLKPSRKSSSTLRLPASQTLEPVPVHLERYHREREQWLELTRATRPREH
jgi:hypothetical protein